MANANKKYRRKVFRIGKGRSYGLVLPMEIMRELSWRERQKLVVRRSGKKIVIEDWPVRKKK